MNSFISSSKLKTFLLKGLLFLAGLFSILFLIESTLLKGATSYTGDQIGKINKILKHQLDTDIAIFGSSVAWVHFNPRIISSETSKQCYNFGLDGTPLIQYKGILHEFASYSNASTVVIAGAFDEFKAREQVYELYKYSPHLSNPNIYESLLNIDSALVWKMHNVPFYKFTTFDKYFYSFAFAGITSNKAKYEKEKFDGFAPNSAVWEEQSVVSNNSAINLELDATIINSYKETIADLNSKNKQVILVLTPIYIAGQSKFRNLDEVRATFKNLAGKENIFLDFTKSDICKNKTLFYNYSHLNASGADLFSKEFSEKLNQVMNEKEVISQVL